MAYAAQAAPASAVNSRNRPWGRPTEPDVRAAAVRPYGRKRPIRMARPPYRRRPRSAVVRATASRPLVNRGPALRPMR
jgi:hypothetical protein